MESSCLRTEEQLPTFPFADSGLMIASRFPILAADFHKFTRKGTKLMLKLFDYGCVMAKLDLGKDKVSIM